MQLDQKPGDVILRHFDMLFVCDYLVPSDPLVHLNLMQNLAEYCVFTRKLGVYEVDDSAAVDGMPNALLDALVY